MQVIAFFLLFFATDSVWAGVGPWQDIPHGKARFFHLEKETNPATQFGIEVLLEPDWHTYWRNPGDSGAAPLIYAINSGEKTKLEVTYPYPERIEVGPLVTYGYSTHVAYFFGAGEGRIDGFKAELLVCKEECIPGFISADLHSLDDFANIGFKNFIEEELKKTKGRIVKGEYSPGPTNTKWSFNIPDDHLIIDLFWYPSQVESLAKLNFIKKEKNEYNFYTGPVVASDTLTKKALVVTRRGVDFYNYTMEFSPVIASFWPFLLFALFGGLILNIMPCVFPIVSLKAFSIAKTSGEELKAVRTQHFFYSFGVVFCFLLLATLISALRQAGQFVGWGFQLQNPIFVFSLTALFLVLALSFFDLWTWNWIPSFASRGQFKTGNLSSFLTGVLAVVVASPCTAPFMGAAIGFALSQPAVIIFVIFSGLGLGMASPFLLLGLFPKVSVFLPKPGAWMNWFKKTMGALLLLTAIWLGWVGSQTLSGSKPLDSSMWRDLDVKNWDILSDTENARFVNFTADWCVSCKVNEKLVFNDSAVEKYFKDNEYLLYKVDWTKRQDAIGRKLAEFGRAGVPLYLYFPKGSQSALALPELLTTELLLSKLKGEKE